MNIKRVLTASAFIAAPLSHAMKLEEIPGLLQQHSDAIKAEQSEIAARKEDVWSSQSRYLPKVTWDTRFTHTDEPTTIDLDGSTLDSIQLGAANSALDLVSAGIAGQSPNDQGTVLSDRIKQRKSAILGSLPKNEAKSIEVQKENFWKSNITVSQPLYTGGRIAAGVKASKAKVSEAQSQEKTVYQAKLKDSLTRYFLVVLSENIISVLSDVEKDVTKMESISNSLVQRGVLPKFEHLQIQVAKAELNARQKEATAKNQLAKIAFKSSLGLEQKQSVSYQSRLKNFQQIDSLESLIKASAAQRPEYGILAAKREALHALKSKETGELLPSLYAFGKYEVVDKYLTALEPNWAVGLGVKVELGSYFSGFQKRAKAQHLLNKVNHKQAEATKNIPVQVQHFYTQAITQQSQMESLSVAENQAQEALRLALVRFESGQGSSLEILKASTSLEQVKVKKLQAMGSYHISLVNLYWATGKTENFIQAYNNQGAK